MNLPIGYQKFHIQKFFNYQMNRLHALGYGREADIKQAAAQIKDRSTYVNAFLEQAERATTEDRPKNAAAYLRAAEFFTPQPSQQKTDIYRQYHETFYNAFADESIDRHEVPYNGGSLPAMQLNADGTKGSVLLFGGFDSLIEEFFVIWKFFANAGYRVIAFEGPGQGGALQMYGHHFDHDYEKPVAAILDHFNIPEAALIGISMGGYWAIRAAAFEPRIKQVVAWSPVYDWLEQLPGFARPILHQLLKLEGFMNATIRLRMWLIPILDHAVKQAMYMVGGEQPMDAVRWLMGMNRQHINSEAVTQDVLLVGGENDAFQPVKLLEAQRAALTNARSVTTRVFTKAEEADMHVQMGNLNLAMGEIEEWLAEKT